MIPCILVLAAASLVAYGAARQPQSDGRSPEAPRQDHAGAAEAAGRDGAEQELGTVLDDFHDAASKSDFARYCSHWTSVSVFLGTDATERWVGEDFKDFAKPYFDKGKGWTYHPHDRHITMGSDEDRAFFDELLDNDKLGLCRGSGCAKKIKGEWKILQYNLSIPVPNDKAERVVSVIRAEAPPAPAVDGKHKE